MLETLLTSDFEVDAHEKSALQSWHTSDSEKGTQSGMNSPLASASRTAAISSSASKYARLVWSCNMFPYIGIVRSVSWSLGTSVAR